MIFSPYCEGLVWVIMLLRHHVYNYLSYVEGINSEQALCPSVSYNHFVPSSTMFSDFEV